MCTTSSNLIAETHPSLTKPFVPHVSHNPITRAMADALGPDKAGYAVTNCGRYASVFQRNTRKKMARATRFVCFLWICSFCGTAHNLLRSWLKTRSRDVRTTPQSGLEIAGASYAATEYAAKRLASYMWRKYRIDSIRRPCIPSGHVRMVFKTRTLSISAVRELLGPAFRVASLRHDTAPLRTLEWLFASTESICRMEDGAERARLFLEWQRGKRLLKTSGKFYSPVQLTAEEKAERRAELSAEEIADGWENIPIERRHVQTVEEVGGEYVAVEWRCAYNLFREGRSPVSHMAAYMSNSDRPRAIMGDATHSPPS